jgi:type IV secretion system protein VirB2
VLRQHGIEHVGDEPLPRLGRAGDGLELLAEAGCWSATSATRIGCDNIKKMNSRNGAFTHIEIIPQKARNCTVYVIVTASSQCGRLSHRQHHFIIARRNLFDRCTNLHRSIDMKSGRLPTKIFTVLSGVCAPAIAHAQSLSTDPQGSGVIIGAARWLQGTLLGTVATVVAVIAVAVVGLLMLSGRINWRHGAVVILGCFILFGAASIVAGIQSAASLSAGN